MARYAIKMGMEIKMAQEPTSGLPKRSRGYRPYDPFLDNDDADREPEPEAEQNQPEEDE